MPLRDHFRPPIWKQASWEGLHGGWPMTIAQQLFPKLPAGFAVEPRVHLGAYYEIDECALDKAEARSMTHSVESGGGLAVATEAPPLPTFVAEFDPTEQYEYEVLVFDQDRNRQLVAAIEIVSPANKDRSENRRKFVAKCAALLQRKVCVSIVDLVTIRKFNLYAEVLDLLGQSDPSLRPTTPATYAVTCRSRQLDVGSQFQTWAYPLIVGQTLPSLPIWLTDDQRIMLDLEPSYEEACRVLGIS
ncbi:MAG TPA: DUF4058 family protein [Pirellulaceae bacterium]|nr:DUF4058 family protein [Pirellulaceae bacterium]